MITGREYIFSYMTNKNSLMYDGMNVIVKQGPFRTTTFSYMSILNWYVYEDKTYRSLFITYTNEAGKQKKVQLFAQLGEPQFAELVEAMNAALGAKSMTHLPQKEAFKAMKVSNPKTVGALAAIIIILVLTTTFMYPGLRHFFEFGYDDEVYVEDLVAGNYDSHNITLYGVPLEETLEETTTSKGTTTIKYFIPIVNEDWDYDQPIEVVMKFDELSDEEYYEIEESIEFTGVVRNIWYEGLDTDQKEFFTDEYGLEVSDDVIMVEVTGDKRNGGMEFVIWCVINGIFIVIFGIVWIRSK